MPIATGAGDLFVVASSFRERVRAFQSTQIPPLHVAKSGTLTVIDHGNAEGLSQSPAY
jgi:hypothetical protein